MKQKKYRVELYSLYDHTGIAAHLEKMAAKGWLLAILPLRTETGAVFRDLFPQGVRL